MKATKPETNSRWGKLCPDVVLDFIGFMTEPIKEIMKETVDMAKKVGEEGFQGTDLGEIQQLINITPEELMENDLMEKTN